MSDHPKHCQSTSATFPHTATWRRRFTLYLTAAVLCIVQPFAYGQTRHQLGAFIGGGKSFVRNQYEMDEAHFRFAKPLSVCFGIAYQWHVRPQTALLARLGIAKKAVRLLYSLNEDAIPYNHSAGYLEKFTAHSLSLGIRHYPKSILDGRGFVEGGLSIDYTINGTIGLVSDGQGNSEPLPDTIFYSEQFNDNLGQGRIGGGAFVGVGLTLGKTRRSEFLLNLAIPFTTLHRLPSTLVSNWRYQGTEYNHSQAVKAYATYASLTYGRTLFRR